ncbi:Cysteine-rich domain protein [Acididesulfobacillus acetoxydans]|uniref:CoB--CoM heterodisulfide reductase-like protein n=1 Tax=Acididesulfobacillus acetoxydans TaxID=1561005 RepID=A0A8S0W8C6_9FIRM|nr:CoB--CoM heterodisulfide reductase iron-sulfur subunit B family protein [Acididesulfobacillus acetoxydans]CAA7601739.1 Cysteine-rich domain protein [Acididesulfobacillus acetoxydans]CEJ09042.1 CoB--CoM heterodisulfide reductase-like protein [Acididesulfobacillus acetoxydans]
MSNYAFYPGCSLHNTARESSQSLLLVMDRLGIGYDEVPDWNCCGGTSAVSLDEQLAVNLAVRNLLQAKSLAGDGLVVPCAHCYHRLMSGKRRVESDPDMRRRVEKELRHPVEDLPPVYNALQVMERAEILEKIRLYAVKSLSGLKVACYYGCQLVRPPRLTNFDHPENPTGLDRIVEILGGEAVPWPLKTECCGGNLSFAKRDVSEKLAQRILDMAIECEAECIVTACPICQANLDLHQFQLFHRSTGAEAASARKKIPVFFFSQLIGLVLGFDSHAVGLSRHFIPAWEALALAGIR